MIASEQRSAEGSRTIGGLAEYVAFDAKDQRRYNERGEIELRGKTVYSDGVEEREVTDERGVRLAANEMRATELFKSAKTKDATYHLVVAEARGDDLTDEQFLEVGKTCMQRIGFGGHKWIATVHNDTGDRHIHFAILRVHPETHKTVSPYRDHTILAEVAREYERAWGLNQTIDRSFLDGAKDGLDQKPETANSARIASHQGHSYERHSRIDFAPKLRDVLGNLPTWEDLHDLAAENGRRWALTHGGKGLALVSIATPELACSASQVLKKAALPQLVDLLGPYRPAAWERRQAAFVPSGALTFEDYVKSHAEDLKRALGAGKWSALQGAAVAIGTKIERKGGGFVIVDARDPRNTVKITELGNAFRGLTKTLGAFEPAVESAAAIDVAGRMMPTAKTSYEAYSESEATLADYNRGEELAADPSTLLHELSATKSTWTVADIALLAREVAVNDEQQSRIVAAAVERCDVLDGGARLTIPEMRRLESDTIAAFLRMAKRHPAAAEYTLPDRVASRVPFEIADEQKAALKRLLDPGTRFAAVVGRAGTGKSTVLGLARQEWESQGLRVRGITTASRVACDMRDEAGIESKTIAGQLIAWKNGRDKPRPGDIWCLEESGMVGSRDQAEIVKMIEKSGAQVKLVGDPEQFQSISAGAMFRTVLGQVDHSILSDVRRQNSEIDRAASTNLSNGDVEKAIALYTERGYTHVLEDTREAISSLVSKWDADRAAHPGATQIVLAAENASIRKLNHAIETLLIERGEISNVTTIETHQGDREFGVGSRVQFAKNDSHLGISNGHLGTIEKIDRASGSPWLHIKLDNGEKTVIIDTDTYNSITGGWAVNEYKSQGATKARSYLLGSMADNFHSIYVAATRHKEEFSLFLSRNQFTTAAAFAEYASKSRYKDTTSDYRLEREAAIAITPKVEPANPRAEEADRRRKDALVQRLAALKESYDAGVRVARSNFAAEKRDIFQQTSMAGTGRGVAGAIVRALRTKERNDLLADAAAKYTIEKESLKAEKARETRVTMLELGAKKAVSEAAADRIARATEAASDANVSRFRDVTWKTGLLGRTSFYDEDGAPLCRVTSKGKIAGIRTDAGAEFALRYAASRFGGATLTGNAIDKERMLARAVEVYVKVSNPELADRQADLIRAREAAGQIVRGQRFHESEAKTFATQDAEAIRRAKVLEAERQLREEMARALASRSKAKPKNGPRLEM